MSEAKASGGDSEKKDIRIKRELTIWHKLVYTIASLRLTVVLFVFAILLVFFGTLAQVDAGVWTVVNNYFRSAFVMVPLQIFFPRDLYVPGAFPFPGGWLIGGLLLTNLLAAHIVRFRLNWKRSGVLVLHAGLIVLMVSEFITGVFAKERHMQIAEGQSTNYMESQRFYELALIDRSDPKYDNVMVVPGSMLQSRETIRSEKLPFEIEVQEYMVNSFITEAENVKVTDNPATKGAGLQHVAKKKPEVSGTATKQEVDAPSAYITLSKNGEKIGTYLVSLWLKEQKIQIGEKTYDLILRFEREYLPFSLHLIDFKFERYPGSNTPKEYTSVVKLIDPEHNIDRRVVISMNQPLRYRGETFFQAGFDERTEQGTILQVVSNPGWLMPYISCVLVGVGMLVHFGIQLILFLQRRLA